MRKVNWSFSCDWCGESETRPVETIPAGWLIILIGDEDKGPNRWRPRKHVCGECWSDDSTLLNPMVVYDASEDQASQE